MKKALLITLLVLGILVVAGALVCTGVFIGRQSAYRSAMSYSVNPEMPWQGNGQGGGHGQFFMPGMRDGQSYPNDYRGNDNNMQQSVTPLTVDQAYQAGSDTLSKMNLPDLKISEVLVFDNVAVVRVVEQSTGIGAFDLFVDPVTQSVVATQGPSTDWNMKYGSLVHAVTLNRQPSGQQTLTVPSNVTADMTVTPEQALQDAQDYLNQADSGATADTTTQAFYGYYSIKVLQDGQVIGLLSVNGTDGQVFMPNWFGNFIDSQTYSG